MLVKCLAAYTHLPSTISEIQQVIGRKLRHVHTPPLWNFVKMFDAGKTRMIGLPYGEINYDDMLSRFDTIPETDRRTVCYINIARQHQCADAR